MIGFGINAERSDPGMASLNYCKLHFALSKGEKLVKLQNKLHYWKHLGIVSNG